MAIDAQGQNTPIEVPEPFGDRGDIHPCFDATGGEVVPAVVEPYRGDTDGFTCRDELLVAVDSRSDAVLREGLKDGLPVLEKQNGVGDEGYVADHCV